MTNRANFHGLAQNTKWLLAAIFFFTALPQTRADEQKLARKEQERMAKDGPVHQQLESNVKEWNQRMEVLRSRADRFKKELTEETTKLDREEQELAQRQRHLMQARENLRSLAQQREKELAKQFEMVSQNLHQAELQMKVAEEARKSLRNEKAEKSRPTPPSRKAERKSNPNVAPSGHPNLEKKLDEILQRLEKIEKRLEEKESGLQGKDQRKAKDVPKSYQDGNIK